MKNKPQPQFVGGYLLVVFALLGYIAYQHTTEPKRFLEQLKKDNQVFYKDTMYFYKAKIDSAVYDPEPIEAKERP